MPFAPPPIRLPDFPLRPFASLRLCERLLVLSSALFPPAQKPIPLSCNRLETQFRATPFPSIVSAFPREGGCQFPSHPNPTTYEVTLHAISHRS